MNTITNSDDFFDFFESLMLEQPAKQWSSWLPVRVLDTLLYDCTPCLNVLPKFGEDIIIY